MQRPPILVPKPALIAAWEWQGRGTPPAVIGMNEYWMPESGKKEFEDKVLKVLTALGLAKDGKMTPDFREILTVLTHGGLRYTGWANDVASGEDGGILVALHGNQAVRALRTAEDVRLDVVPQERALESLVDALPDMRPVALNPIKIPKSEFTPDKPRLSENYRFDMPTRYEAPDPLDRLRALLKAKRAGAHQFYVHKGTARSSPVTIVDIMGEGRLLSFMTDAPGQETQLNFLPGTRQNIMQTMYSTAQALR
jgi:hypothetical protein